MKQIVSKRPDIAFHILLMPLKQIHPEAYGKSKAVLCAKDNETRLKLLDDAFEKKPMAEASCESDAVDRIVEFAAANGINSTPTMIFQSGLKENGALPAEKILKIIDGK